MALIVRKSGLCTVWDKFRNHLAGDGCKNPESCAFCLAKSNGTSPLHLIRFRSHCQGRNVVLYIFQNLSWRSLAQKDLVEDTVLSKGLRTDAILNT